MVIALLDEVFSAAVTVDTFLAPPEDVHRGPIGLATQASTGPNGRHSGKIAGLNISLNSISLKQSLSLFSPRTALFKFDLAKKIKSKRPRPSRGRVGAVCTFKGRGRSCSCSGGAGIDGSCLRHIHERGVLAILAAPHTVAIWLTIPLPPPPTADLRRDDARQRMPTCKAVICA